MMPIAVPKATARTVADSAIAREKEMPYHIRDSTSRPVPGSTPSQWSEEMPPRSPLGMPPSETSRRLSSPLLCKLSGSITPNFTRNGARIAAVT
jgi:hypothetical protein